MTWEISFEALNSGKTATANDYVINPDNNDQCEYVTLLEEI